MSLVGIMNIDQAPGGLDRWSLSHAAHHQQVTQRMNVVATPTGTTTAGSEGISSLSSINGIISGMEVGGAGIQDGTEVVSFTFGQLVLSQPATASASNVALTIRFPGPLQFFILDPIAHHNTQRWLFDHQRSHDLINDLLGVTGNDLETVDFTDQKQFRAWLDLHFPEHQSWATALNIS